MIYDIYWYMIYDVKSDHIICWHGEGKWSHCWKNKASLLSSPFFWIPWVWTRRVLQVENAHGELSSIGWWKLATSIIDDRWWQMAELPIDWCSIFSLCFLFIHIEHGINGACVYHMENPLQSPKGGIFFSTKHGFRKWVAGWSLFCHVLAPKIEVLGRCIYGGHRKLGSDRRLM